MPDLAALFLEYAESVPEYVAATDLVARNNRGRTWLIGGFLFRTLAMRLYGAPRPATDLDFIVERPLESPRLPDGWTASANRYGNLKLIGPTTSIDFIPLQNIHALVAERAEPTIENFLRTPPLTVQALAFDLQERRLLGDAGIAAILARTVGVHNQASAAERARRYGHTVEDYVQEKAEGLGFAAESHR